MAFHSPRTAGSTPTAEADYIRMTSATPSPSPRANWVQAEMRRPATRVGHSRGYSYSQPTTHDPRPPRDSPRYNSSGHYSTADKVNIPVSVYTEPPRVDPRAYSREYSRDPTYDTSRPIAQARAPTSHSRRRASTSTPQRSATARPVSYAQPPAPSTPRLATEQDAKKHSIPAGFSLKNWDPEQQPILLLGSVFDPNSLGKWIYDWTGHSVGSTAPLAEVAGDLWLQLIDLSDKSKKLDQAFSQTRSKSARTMLLDYSASADRLWESIRRLLKSCEAPMLRASKSKKTLSKNAGVDFVDTMFGVDHELDQTEALINKIRHFGKRYDQNAASTVEKLLRA